MHHILLRHGVPLSGTDSECSHRLLPPTAAQIKVLMAHGKCIGRALLTFATAKEAQAVAQRKTADLGSQGGGHFVVCRPNPYEMYGPKVFLCLLAEPCEPLTRFWGVGTCPIYVFPPR